MSATPKLMTVAATSLYEKQARTLLEEQDRDGILNYLSDNPEAGNLIRGTGGLRKLRWALPGRGKSGGVRVIYYFYNEEIPLWLLSVFSKNEQENLTEDQKRLLSGIVDAIKRTAKERGR
jgi:mRNA-degrading endonuclease RelE of RelBE toxin-antitoxin system